jgi:aminoglycoside phosphotransferase (APT) family kinase protein
VGWRGSEAPLVLHGFAGGAQVIVAKVARGTNSASLEREAESLRVLRDDAVAAGARLPTLVASEPLGDAWAIVETPVSGTPAAILLASQPSQLLPTLGRLARWLLRWSEATRTDQAVSAERLAVWLDEPLQLLRSDLPDPYAARLAKTAARLLGTTAPLVAAHHDLTMSNVLVDETHTIGVVDWEEAEPHGLPLADFIYAATDLVLAAHGGTRLDAFRSCFEHDGRHAGTVRGHLNALTEALGLSPDLVRLCFDACWLRHARNEAERAQPGRDRPFQELLRWHASHGDRLYVPEPR